jgi:hypothetical protein
VDWTVPGDEIDDPGLAVDAVLVEEGDAWRIFFAERAIAPFTCLEFLEGLLEGVEID